MLPCPVMYVDVDEENDDQMTNPDLFSDTQSRTGSQSTNDDGVYAMREHMAKHEVRMKLNCCVIPSYIEAQRL